MILESKNFNISLWNWNMLCLNDVYWKPTESNPYWQIINGEEFLKKAAVILLQLAEKEFKKWNIKLY